MKCTNCKTEIPAKRVQLGYKECVNCSTVESYGCVDIVYHKTGNTLEIMNKQDAAKINKLARRSGFGVMRGIVTSKNKSAGFAVSHFNNEEPVTAPVQLFNQIGEKAANLLDESGAVAAKEYIFSAYRDRKVNLQQRNDLLAIIEKFSRDKPVAVFKNRHNPYTKTEPPAEKSEISEDTAWAFKNWKK